MPKPRNRRKAKKEKKNVAVDMSDPFALKAEGVKAASKGDWKKAESMFSRGIDLLTKQTDKVLKSRLYGNRSFARGILGAWDQALQDGRICVESDPSWAKGYLRQASALSALQHYPEALKSYQKAKNMDQKLDVKRQIEDISQKIKELQLESSFIGGPGANHHLKVYEDFIEWMTSNGAKLSSVYLHVTSQGDRGVRVKTNVDTDTQLITIPQKLLLTIQKAKESDIGKAIQQSEYKLRSKHSYMACFILEHLNHKAYKCDDGDTLRIYEMASFWYPYLQVARRAPVLETMPIFLPEYYQNMLKGTVAGETVRYRAESLRDEYIGLCSVVEGIRKYSLSDFMWARCVVLSRIIGLRVKQAKISAMVPFLDMVNHGYPSSCTWRFLDQTNHLTITASQPLVAGSEILANYGRKCNSRFFLNYGFTVTPNPNNQAVLMVSMDANSPHYSEKCEFLKKAPRYVDSGWEHKEFQVLPSTTDMNFRRLFSFLRYTRAKGKDFDMFQDAFDIEAIGPVSVRNEIEVLRCISECSLRALSRFPSTIQADHKRIKLNRWSSPGHLHCVTMRSSEREVLLWFQHMAQEGLKILNLDWSGVRKPSNALRKGSSFGMSLSAYIRMITPMLNNPNCI